MSSESLLVVRNLGLQINTRYFFGFSRSRFVTTLEIHQIMILEGIRRFQVRFYLAVLVKDETELMVVFEVKNVVVVV
jgi:phosphatidylinositol glycan class H protein